MDNDQGVEIIWYEDPRGFLEGDRLACFIPEKNSSLVSQLNALLRLSMYFSLILMLFRRYSLAIYIPLGVALLTYFMFTNFSAEVASTRDKRLHLQEGLTREGKLCTIPTSSNPYMNALPNDRPNRPPACSIVSSAKAINALTKDDLFLDVDDVFNKRTLLNHVFYTMPNTSIPNDQTGFARWCYDSGPTCKKGDGSHCLSSSDESVWDSKMYALQN